MRGRGYPGEDSGSTSPADRGQSWWTAELNTHKHLSSPPLPPCWLLSSGLDKSFYERSVGAKILFCFILLLSVHIAEAVQNWDGNLHFAVSCSKTARLTNWCVWMWKCCQGLTGFALWLSRFRSRILVHPWTCRKNQLLKNQSINLMFKSKLSSTFLIFFFFKFSCAFIPLRFNHLKLKFTLHSYHLVLAPVLANLNTCYSSPGWSHLIVILFKQPSASLWII